MTADEAAGQLLIYGLTDWVDLGWARQFVRDDHPAASAAELRDATLDLVERLLTLGLVVAGDLRDGFVPWEAGPDESSARIRESWQDPDDRLLPGDVCWLSTTEAGDALADRLLRRS